MRELDPYASMAAFFGSELRRYRLAAEKSQEQVARAINYSTALVGSVETATKVSSLDFAQRCDRALGTGGALEKLWWLMYRLANGEIYPSWFRPWLEHEREATSLRVFEPLLITGLLQTQDYARAVVAGANPTFSEEELDQQVAARLERQAILAREDPPTLWVILDEGALRRPIGSPKTMCEQLDYLVRAARSPRTVVQVVPAGVGAHAGLTGAFAIASFAGSADVAYQEGLTQGRVVDRPEEVAECSFAFDTLRAVALSPAESIELMLRIKGEH